MPSWGESGSLEDWATDSVAAARAEHQVPDAIVERLRRELCGALSERPLRPSEQTTLARALLAAMTPAKGGGTQG